MKRYCGCSICFISFHSPLFTWTPKRNSIRLRKETPFPYILTKKGLRCKNTAPVNLFFFKNFLNPSKSPLFPSRGDLVVIFLNPLSYLLRHWHMGPMLHCTTPSAALLSAAPSSAWQASSCRSPMPVRPPLMHASSIVRRESKERRVEEIFFVTNRWILCIKGMKVRDSFAELLLLCFRFFVKANSMCEMILLLKLIL